MDLNETMHPPVAKKETKAPASVQSLLQDKDPLDVKILYKGTDTDLKIFLTRMVGRGKIVALFEGKLFTTPAEIVVVKLFPSALDKDAVLLIDREILRWSGLGHRCVLPFYGFCAVGSAAQIGLVSPYMKNGNMRDFLEINPGVDRYKLLREVAEGLAYLHEEAGVVHGDLKCANVLISSPEETALLADFGLSTVLDETEDTTATWIRRMKTVAWAAPELFSQKQDEAFHYPLSIPGAAGPVGKPRSKTTHTDCYAFGMLVYEAISGQPPWGEAGDYDIWTRVISKQRPPRGDNFTEKVWKLCTACWEHDPASRLDAPGIMKATSEL